MFREPSDIVISLLQPATLVPQPPLSRLRQGPPVAQIRDPDPLDLPLILRYGTQGPGVLKAQRAAALGRLPTSGAFKRGWERWSPKKKWENRWVLALASGQLFYPRGIS